MNWSILSSPIVQRNVDGWTQNLETSNNVEMFQPSDQWDLARGLVISSPWETDHLCPCDSSSFTGLIPSSHLKAQPFPILPRMGPTLGLRHSPGPIPHPSKCLRAARQPGASSDLMETECF